MLQREHHAVKRTRSTQYSFSPRRKEKRYYNISNNTVHHAAKRNDIETRATPYIIAIFNAAKIARVGTRATQYGHLPFYKQKEHILHKGTIE